MNLHYRATLQKMNVSSLLPDRSGMFQFDVHCRPIINKTVLLLDDWRDPFPPVFIYFLHYSLYSSHSHISEKPNKKILLAGSLQGPLILAKGTNIVCWMQGRLEPSKWSILTFVHSRFFFLLFVQSNTNSGWHWVVSDMFLRKLIPPSRNKCLIKFNKFTINPRVARWRSVKTRRTLGLFPLLRC